MEIITINGSEYEVLARRPATHGAPVIAYRLDLRKVQNGTHVYRASQMASGAYSEVIDTKIRLNGSRAR